MNLKTKLTLSTVMLASYANVAVAEFYEAPFLAPRHCDGKLIQGHKNAGGFYLSESCNTVFVRPPDIGVAEYTIGSVEVNDQACDDYQQGLATIRKGQMQKDKLTELISNPNAKKADIEKWSMQRDLVQQAMNDADASLDKSAAWAGLKASVRFQSNAATEVQKYQQDNLLLLTQGARFQEVDIRESYLSFPQISGEAPQRAQMVVAVNSPGIEVRGLKSSPGSASAALKGAKSIAISFGMNAICNLRRAETEKQRQLRGNLKYQASVHDLKFAPADMEANFPVVLTYSVAVQSGYKYKASLDYNLMLDQSMKFFEHRPDQFTLDAFTSEFIDNDTNNAIKWEFEALPQAQGTKEAEDWAKSQKEEVIAGFMRQVLNALEGLQIVKKLDPVPRDKPLPGPYSETYYREVCRSKSFMGVTYSHRCWQEPYQVVRIHGASSRDRYESVRNLNLKFSEVVEMRSPIFDPRTATFEFVRAEERNLQ